MKQPPTLLALLAQTPALLWTADRALLLASVTGLGSSTPSIPTDECPLSDFLPPNELLLSAHRLALKGESTRVEFSANQREWLALVTPLHDGSGVSAMAFDRTDQAVAEHSVRFSEQSYRSLIEEAPVAFCRVTPSGQLLQVNRAMVEMLQYESEQELLIQNMRSDVFARAVGYDEILATLQTKGALHGLESSWITQDRRSISVSISGRTRRGQSGEISFVELVTENITERKELQHQLLQAQKMQAVGQLAGGIAHDFNNLLTVIHGQVQLVLAELRDNDPLRDRLSDVEDAATRAANLTRQLLAFGRLQTVEARVINLNSIVAGMTNMLSRLIDKNVDLQFHPAPDLFHVKADPAQIEQILMNLVLNAKDATPDGGTIVIATENARLNASLALAGASPVAPPGDYIALSVSDTGAGMSTDTRARIFEPFFTTKKPGEGTGLGLATVYSIVKQSRGSITVQSEPGAGSRFTVYLPRDSGLTRPEPRLRESAVLKGTEFLLLVDDEESIRKLTASFLSSLGYRVVTAADGVEALAVARAHAGSIDLLITDIVMPRLGGRELAEELRKSDPRLKILFMTGYPGSPEARDSIQKMDARLIQKPFASMPAFAGVVRSLLDARPIPSPASNPSLPQSE